MTWSGFTVEGGSLIEGLVGFVLAIGTIIVGTWVAMVAYHGYKRSENPSALFLAAGIALTSAGYTGTRILVPTTGGSSLLTDAVASAVQFAGLVLVLYAVYGRPERRTRYVLGGTFIGAGLLALVPFVLVEVFGMTLSAGTTGANGPTAVLGAFITIQALRGYSRYGNRSMRWLAIGIALLTFVPFLVLELLTLFRSTLAISDARGLSLVLFTELVGVLAILLSLQIDEQR
ncbi:DUF7521 family protein [Halalkalicoccus tibetensis]|uniref:Uncharacterized protein n=1 Tax=Halalkalicoccus tibetensis TaxID=175632 RepID=A0ABD5V6L8_9EURY